MRLDRVVTLAVSRQQWLKSRLDDRRLPVLMYHSVCEERQSKAAYYQTVTHPAIFAEQMALLKRQGYRGVTLTEGLRWLQSSGPDATAKPVALTFDDGYADFLTGAAPTLDVLGFAATIYLPTASIQPRRARFKDRDCLTWGEIRKLNAAGIEFGSHTVTHPRLVQLGWTEIRAELATSRAAIEQHLGAAVTAFAYPYAFPQERGEFVERFSEILSETGYASCVTTTIGRVGVRDDRFCLRRLPVNSCDDAPLLRAKLEGSYDWMAPAQLAVKRAKQLIRLRA